MRVIGKATGKVSFWPSAAALALLALTALQAPAARGDDGDDPLIMLARMNTKAVEAYLNLDFAEARKILESALAVSAANKLERSPLAARTHLHLGAVLFTGFKQRERAVAELRVALAIQPDIKLADNLDNPEIEQLIRQAAAPAPPPPPPVAAVAAPAAAPPAETKAVKAPSGSSEKAAAPDAEPPPVEPITHAPVTKGVQGRAVPIEVKTAASLAPAKVVLAFRAYDAADYVRIEMSELSPGRWTGEIRKSAAAGDEVAYYIEVQNASGEPIAYKGSATEPLVVALRKPGLPEVAAVASAAEEEESAGPHWYVALTVGGGGGWTSGSGEVTPRGTVGSGQLAPAELAHVAPEIGYFVSDGFMISAQLRLQYVTGTTPQNAPAGSTDCGADGVCNGATTALAGFLRATWLWGEASFHPYLAATAGGGRIRHVATLKNVSTCGDAARPVPCVDTVAAGPLFVGAGAGFIFNATDTIGLTVGLNALAGFPTFTAHVDLNAGVAFEF